MMTFLSTDFAAPTLQLAFGIPGGPEWIILLIIGLLIFGRRLPEVGRWLGQGIVEFKRGIKGIDDEIEHQSTHKPDRLEEKKSDTVSSEQRAEARATSEGLTPPQ